MWSTCSASCEGGNQVSILPTFYMQLLCHYSCAKNLQSQTVSRENVHKALFFSKRHAYNVNEIDTRCQFFWLKNIIEKASCKMWVKLTTVPNTVL
jgi:hypothetical protein